MSLPFLLVDVGVLDVLDVGVVVVVVVVVVFVFVVVVGVFINQLFINKLGHQPGSPQCSSNLQGEKN